MDSEAGIRRAKIAAKVIAGLIGALGIYLVAIIIPTVRAGLECENLLSYILFLFIFPIPIVALGCYCLFVSYSAWSRISVENVRRISLVGSLVLVLTLGGILHSAFEEGSIWRHATMALCMVPAGIFYWLTKKILTKWLGLPATIDWKQREKTAKTFFGLLGLFSYQAFLGFFIQLEEVLDHSEGLWWWPFTALVVPLVAAVVIYKVGVHVALRNKGKNIVGDKGKSISSTDKCATVD